ncbi:MAG: hypothetical protein PUP46_09000, partial [Endozoicomonas sp. (ex Botrylloides leachii)]|nr:hypothetical protein [Endozoicomonas sp. (ex Botrylloides leachii)]
MNTDKIPPKHSPTHANNDVNTRSIESDHAQYDGRAVSLTDIPSPASTNDPELTKPTPEAIALMNRKLERLAEEDPARTIYKRHYTRQDAKLELAANTTLKLEDPAIIAYMSKGNYINLNQEAIGHKDNQPIECRHLADAFVTGVFGHKNKLGEPSSASSISSGENNNRPIDNEQPKKRKNIGGKFLSISTAEKIAAHPSIKTTKELDGLTPDNGDGVAEKAYYFSGIAIGHSLYKIALQCLNTGDSQGWVLNSATHAMGLMVEHQKEGTFQLVFYDPDDSLRVWRLTVPNREALKMVTLNDLIPNPADLNQNFFGPDYSGVLRSTNTIENANEATVELDGDVNPSLINQLMGEGHLGKKDIATRIKPHFNKSKELIEAEVNGATGVYFAMQNGHFRALNNYFNLLRDSRQRDKKIFVKNLISKSSNPNTGMTCLFIALYNKNTRIINNFFDNLKACGINESDKKWLKEWVEKPENNDVTSLSFELAYGNPESINTLFNNLKAFGIDKNDPEDKQWLK